VSVSGGWTSPEDPWLQGWSVEPFVTAPVPGTGRATLPSFGSLIAVDQPGIALLDLRRAAGEGGMTVVLQELLGASRDVTLGPGVLAFGGGRRLDFLDRDLGPLTPLPGGGVTLPVPAHGVVAARLTDIALAGV
jgi:hypothetical protein